MAIHPLDQVRTDAALRELTRATLTEWMTRIDSGNLPVYIPKPRGLMRLIPGKVFHLHAELFLQLSGETVFEFPEERIRVGPGSLCVVPRGMPHYEKIRAWKGPFYNLVFMYGATSLSFHLAAESPQHRPYGCVASRMPIAAEAPVTATLEQAFDIAPVHTPAGMLGVKGLLLAHFALLLKSLEGWSQPHEPEPFKVAQARQLVMGHLQNPKLSVSWLARELHCSVDYLSQLFRKTTGTPLLAYINQHRLRRAQELLQTTGLNIAEVSQATGFRDPSYFTRFFHQQTGLTPRAFRKKGA